MGTMVVEPVIMQPENRRRPSWPTPPRAAAKRTMVNAGVGLLDISSVYDFDGIDTAKPNIAGMPIPAKRPFIPGPHRFMQYRKGRGDSRQDGAQDQQFRLRPGRHGHARNLGLRARPTGRLGADPGTGQCAFHHRHARYERQAASGAAHQLAAAAARRDQELQRLPLHRQHDLAWPRRADRCRSMRARPPPDCHSPNTNPASP